MGRLGLEQITCPNYGEIKCGFARKDWNEVNRLLFRKYIDKELDWPVMQTTSCIKNFLRCNAGVDDSATKDKMAEATVAKRRTGKKG